MSSRSSRGDQRLRSTGESSPTRAARVDVAHTEERDESLLSDDDVQSLLRSEFIQEALPKLTAPPGWHYCWLAKNSAYDPIHKRMRLGYVPVPFAELTDAGLAGFEQYKVSGGDLDGCVSCNEMVLFKITQQRYQLIMTEFHHKMPMEEESGIKSQLVASQTDKKGRRLMDYDDEDEGLQRLGEPVRAPQFT